MTSTASVFERFRADHRHVKSRLDALERAIDAGGPLTALTEHELEGTVVLLKHQFASHVTAEEQLLYPALVEAFPEAAPGLEPLEIEHLEMRSMVARLGSLLTQPSARDRDEQLVVQSRDLIDLLRIHIRKEEQAVFDVASRVLTAPELAKLAERVAGHRGMIDPESGPGAGKGIRS